MGKEKRKDLTGKEELLGIKMRQATLSRNKSGPWTPVPSWKMEDEDHDPGGFILSKLSARKLGATLWEIQRRPVAKISRDFRLRYLKDSISRQFPALLSDPHTSISQPKATSIFYGHSPSSSVVSDQNSEGNSCIHATQSLSPCYSNSVEVADYNQSPISFPLHEGKHGHRGYRMKTSTELLKVMNHIWTLEKQNISNLNLVKILKLRLEDSKNQIQELKHEKDANEQEVYSLMDVIKQNASDKQVNRNGDYHKIKPLVQSLKDELECEKKLRRRSESLHYSLARELSEIKSALSTSLRELEEERNDTILLENLCDEFARGVRDYEIEVRALKCKFEKDAGSKTDQLILHMSEAWLDERIQSETFANTNSPIHKLRTEVEIFVQARHSRSKNDDIYHKKTQKNNSLPQHSFESIHLNEAVSAPRDAEDDESIASGSHHFELHKNFGISKHHREKDLESKRKSVSHRKAFGHEKIVSQESLGQYEGDMNRTKPFIKNKVEINPNNSRATFDKGKEKQNLQTESSNFEILNVKERRSNKSDFIEMPSKSQSFHSGGGNEKHAHVLEEYSCDNRSSWKSHSIMDPRNSSPINIVSQSFSPDFWTSESSSKWLQGIKENSLKAKLLEARLEDQQTRMKSLKAPNT